MSTLVSIYMQRIAGFSAGIDRLRKPLRWIPWLRLTLFILTGFSIFYAFKFPGLFFIVSSVSFFGGFLAAGWYDTILKRKILRLQRMIKINEQELPALQHDFSAFNPGNEFVSQEHPYTFDLDIFGTGSLFQYLNRTSTVFGKEKLADYFSRAYSYRDEIRARQQAVAELAADIEFRQKLQLIFVEEQTSLVDLAALKDWLNDPSGMPGARYVKVLSFLLPAVTSGSILLSAFGIIPVQFPVFMVLLQLMVVFAYGRKAMAVHQAVTSQVDILRKYAMALTLATETTFAAEFNRKLQDGLSPKAGMIPGKLIKRLSELLNMMDANLNLLVSVIMNGLFMFNIHVLMAVEKWRVANRNLVPEWFAILAEFDALSSLGTYAFNNPGYAYPVPVSDRFQFIAEKIGHPLISSEICVTNDIDITGWNQFRIITGANMSGKSTFLRTIGTNLLLAMTGAPVFAEKLIFYPIEIHSSIRTNDSLAKRESYFYAELRRLKEIITDLEAGREKLILLDEILKGTNSSDKQTGSIALIRQLMKYKLAGLFATHDLALGELVNHYPENIRNLCFEIRITGDKMEIDYKLSPGVCRNLNASFLMKNMGIILEEEHKL